VSYFYLVSSMPHVVFGEAPPVAVDRFRLSCQGVLTESDLCDLHLALEGRAAEGTSDAARRWHGYDTQIRNAIAHIRMSGSDGDARGVMRDHPGYAVWVDHAITEAFARANPLERDEAIALCRWQAADDLVLADPFGFAAVLACGIKLQIAERSAGMTDEAGREAVDTFIDANVSEIQQIK